MAPTDGLRSAGRSLALFSVLLAPALYVVGRSYQSTWLRHVGLDATVFPQTVDETLYDGYVAILSRVAPPVVRLLPNNTDIFVTLFVLWVVASLLVHGLGAFLASSAALRTRHWLIARFWRVKPAVSLAGSSYMLASFPIVLMGIAVYALMLAILPLWAGEVIGKRDGERALSDLSRKLSIGKFGTHDLVLISNGGQQELLIKCGQLGCGSLGAAGSRFVPWDQVESISPRPRSDDAVGAAP
jgi:hypothetical protein